MKFIDVCVATYKRPEMLTALLHSLLAQDLGELCMRIIVIDNDIDTSARSIVENVRTLTAVEIVYDVEPCQGISMARNRALKHVSADFFAFVDDDETVSTAWLFNLFSTMQNHDADVVFGPVVGHLPPDAPEWFKVQSSFRRPNRTTGTRVEYGGSGNVLIRTVALGQPSLMFDPAFGLSGGEDTDFFYKLYLAGKRLVWCDEAVATEPVPASRLTPEWLRQRGFRSGQSFVRIFVRRYPLPKQAVWVVMKILQLFGGIIAVPFVRIISYPSYVRLTVRIMAALGQLSIVFNQSVYEEYRAESND